MRIAASRRLRWTPGPSIDRPIVCMYVRTPFFLPSFSAQRPALSEPGHVRMTTAIPRSGRPGGLDRMLTASPKRQPASWTSVRILFLYFILIAAAFESTRARALRDVSKWKSALVKQRAGRDVGSWMSRRAQASAGSMNVCRRDGSSLLFWRSRQSPLAYASSLGSFLPKLELLVKSPASQHGPRCFAFVFRCILSVSSIGLGSARCD